MLDWLKRIFKPTSPQFEDLTEEQQSPYYEEAAEMLSNLYWCDRVWEAWSVGTMTEYDFINADEDEDILYTVASRLYNFYQGA